MPWDLINTIISVIIIPIVALLIKIIDKRSQKREEANKEFNGYVLWGFSAIGGLTKANTVALKRKEVDGEVDEALAEYNRFQQALDKFTHKQTSQTM